jgi:cell division protein FtsI/penicillin-binding protein 2
VSVFNQSRKNVIRLIFIGTVPDVIIARLFTLQVITSKYKILAEDQGIFRKVIYPDRGIVFDRKNRSVFCKIPLSTDLMVSSRKDPKGTDTTTLCNILQIDTAEFRKTDHRQPSSKIKVTGLLFLKHCFLKKKWQCSMKTCSGLLPGFTCRKDP